MNIVELLGKDPRIFCVIDLEAAVGRDACGECHANEEQEIRRKRVLESVKESGKE